MKSIYCLLGMIVLLGQTCYAQGNAINNSYFGVPTSPAFELLPDKPSEVTHVATPKDFTTFIPLTFSGKSLLPNIGFDIRPGAYLVGSLEEYQKNKWKQILWRSVLSGGTAAIKDSKDIFLSAGLRLSLIDQGDPRAYRDYTDKLEDTVTNSEQQPQWEENEDDSVNTTFTTRLDPIRKKFIEDHWNALKLEAGIANMWRAKSANIRADSVHQNRVGVWIASSLPLGKRMQLMVSAKNAWLETSDVTAESSRASAGARLRAFFTTFAVSVEYARIGSVYKESKNLNEEWNHFAALLEIPVPKLKGVLGITYGGDSDHRTNDDGKFELRYSVYTDKIIKK